MPWLAVRGPSLNLECDRRDPDLFHVLALTVRPFGATAWGTYGSESHVLDVVQLLDDALIGASAVLTHGITFGRSASIGTREAGRYQSVNLLSTMSGKLTDRSRLGRLTLSANQKQMRPKLSC